MRTRRTAPLVALAAVSVALAAAAVASARTTPASRWAVGIVLTQTTSWSYSWEGTGTDGCAQSEHGSGTETIVVRTARPARETLTLDSAGVLHVGKARYGVAKGKRVRHGSFVSSTHEDSDAFCEASSERSTTRGCGARAYSAGFALGPGGGGGTFRVVTRGGGGWTGACPTPPSFSASQVAFGTPRTLRGTIPLSGLRNPHTSTVTVSVAYNGEAPYVGTDLTRPEQTGNVRTQTRVTVVLKRI